MFIMAIFFKFIINCGFNIHRLQRLIKILYVNFERFLILRRTLIVKGLRS